MLLCFTRADRTVPLFKGERTRHFEAVTCQVKQEGTEAQKMGSNRATHGSKLPRERAEMGDRIPKIRRSQARGRTLRNKLKGGPRQPEDLITSELHEGVSCSTVVTRIDPVPIVMASCAVNRNARMLSSGLPRSACAAITKTRAASPKKRRAIQIVPK